MDASRVRRLNDKPLGAGKTCVIYVMGRDQRVQDNHALALAQQQALKLEVPLAVVFCLLPRSGQRAREQYRFMLDGLRQVEADLAKLNIPFMLLLGPTGERLGGVLHHLRPQLVVFDFSPLRGPLTVHQAVADKADCMVVEVDTHNLVPAWAISDHQEFGARTLRTKLNRQWPDHLDPPPALRKHPHIWPGTVKTLQALSDRIDELVEAVPANGTDISRFGSGETAAHEALRHFIEQRLEGYDAKRNDPAEDGESDLSPYLHYGQLCAAAVVRSVLEAVGDSPSLQADADALLEQIIVRKELSDNYCLYNQKYDSLDGAPDWARRTLDKHADDPRDPLYNAEELEQARTHDPAWNAAQLQLIRDGKMHGYMRMYWAKKVLEWSASPAEALRLLVYMNDFYSIDGGDPNGYVGMLWSVGGLHDRPWGERAVYGVVRSMVYNGLKRKFDIQSYIDRFPTADTVPLTK